MNNVCTFIGWKILGDISYDATPGKERISFTIGSSRPNPQGVWGNVRCVAFGEKAAHLHEKVEDGWVMHITAEMTFYKKKDNTTGSSFLIKDYQALYNSKQPKNPSEGVPAEKEKPEQQHAPVKETVSSDGNINGYDAMMEFMMS